MQTFSTNYTPKQLEFIDAFTTYLDETSTTISDYIEARKKDDTEFETEDFEKDFLEKCKIFNSTEGDPGLQYFSDMANTMEMHLASEVRNLFYSVIGRLRAVRERALGWSDYFNKRHDNLESYALLFANMKKLLAASKINRKIDRVS